MNNKFQLYLQKIYICASILRKHMGNMYTTQDISEGGHSNHKRIFILSKKFCLTVPLLINSFNDLQQYSKKHSKLLAWEG